MATPSSPFISGIREVVFSTFNIQRVAAPFVDIAGYRFQALPDAPARQFAQWHVPAGCTRIEQALLVPGHPEGSGGSLRLVTFHGVEQHLMRSSQRSWDTGGIFDIDVYSTDVATTYRQLQRHGWTALGEPVDYREADFSVRQVVAVGPDGMVVAIIQRYSPPVPGLRANEPMSPIFNSTQMVADFDRAFRFYTGVLGWEPWLNFQITNQPEPGADVLGLPMPHARTARRQIAMLRPSPDHPASIELIANADMHGRDFAATCVAPNVGILSLRIPMPDATRYAGEVEARGGALYAQPTTFDVAPYGPVTMFSIRTPEGAILEFLDTPTGETG